MKLLDDILIRIEGLTFTRNDRDIFRDLSMQIPRGKVTAIMGPSGTGKTTLLKLKTILTKGVCSRAIGLLAVELSPMNALRNRLRDL